MWSKMVLHEAIGVLYGFPEICFWFFDFEERLISLCISDFEVDELYSVDIVLWETEKVIRWLRKWLYIFDSDRLGHLPQYFIQKFKI